MKKIFILLVLIVFSFIPFCQENGDTVTDVEGNVYKTIKIGNQTWMLENLKTTRYNSGAPIQQLIDAEKWKLDVSGAYCLYNDDDTNKDAYGVLYNWATIKKGNLAPKGWHIPTIEEWQELIDFLGGEKIAGGKLKDLGTDFWDSPNKGADNSSGFKAVASGYRSNLGTYASVGNRSVFWTATSKNILQAQLVILMFNSPKVYVFSNSKNFGCSVRCIKD
ncbi:MAG: fibrobacter succinogenes major paralogous domain-containing protein [Mariniphaga sp.]|nr:fibrobacter succinogenes major paralogous domain-containing protein [Mariniphaga sp.]